jgi:hypothetical protein
VRPGLEEHGALARGAFAVVVLVSLAVLFAPASDVPPAPAGVDKAIHAALFLALAFTGRWAGAREAVLVAGLVGYATVSELVQGLTPLARSATVADWLADVVGILIGLLLWRLVGRRAAAG